METTHVPMALTLHDRLRSSRVNPAAQCIHQPDGGMIAFAVDAGRRHVLPDVLGEIAHIATGHGTGIAAFETAQRNRQRRLCPPIPAKG